MQRYQLFAISIDGLSLQFDDLHHRLAVQGRWLSLRLQVYLLVRALVVRAKACEAGQVADRVIGHMELCRETDAPDLHALRVIVSEARQELHHCLLIISEYGRGYFIRGGSSA